MFQTLEQSLAESLAVSVSPVFIRSFRESVSDEKERARLRSSFRPLDKVGPLLQPNTRRTSFCLFDFPSVHFALQIAARFYEVRQYVEAVVKFRGSYL